VKLEIDGTFYEHDPDDLTIGQCAAIEKHIGGTIADWDKGLLEGSTECYRALGWVIFKDADVKVPIRSVDFVLAKLARPYLTARLEEIQGMQGEIDKLMAEQAEPDPTLPPGLRPPPPAPGPTSSPAG